MKKRIAILVLTLVVALTTAFVSGDTMKENRSIQAYNELMQSFCKSGAVPFSEENMEECDYPDNYGGAYINEEGKLVIKVSENAAEVNSTDNFSVVIDENDVQYESAEHSYEELLAEYNKISDYMVDGNKKESSWQNISAVAIDERENRVVVTMQDISEDAIILFKQDVSSSPLIYFKEAKYTAKREASKSLDLGSPVIGNRERMGSIGFRCKKRDSSGNYTIKGFVTAGHVAKAGEDVYIPGAIIYDNYKKIGETVQSINTSGGKVDAAFVEITDSSYEASLKTFVGSDELYGGSAYGVLLPPGASVKKCGAVSNITSGKVINNTATIKYSDGTTFKDVVEASYASSEGDSGGVVYSGDNLCGIHQGSDTNGYKVYIKYVNILPALTLLLY